jgi:hypothetical protein
LGITFVWLINTHNRPHVAALPSDRRGSSVQTRPSTVASVRHRYVEAFHSESAKERDKITLLLVGQFRAEHQIEELNRIIKREQAPIVQIGRGLLDAAQGKALMAPSPTSLMRLIIAGLKKRSVLRHQVVGVIGRGMASIASTLAEEDLLSPQFGLRGFARIELAEHIELRRWREAQFLLEFRH